MDLKNCIARPRGVTQSESRSDELKRRVTTATPVRSPMEPGKEPSERFELTADARGRQEAGTHSMLFVGDFGWHFVGSHKDVGQNRESAWWSNVAEC